MKNGEMVKVLKGPNRARVIHGVDWASGPDATRLFVEHEVIEYDDGALDDVLDVIEKYLAEFGERPACLTLGWVTYHQARLSAHQRGIGRDLDSHLEVYGVPVYCEPSTTAMLRVVPGARFSFDARARSWRPQFRNRRNP